jgi:uncharacterized protein YdhG (YjbR/CyaY superfamily)
MTTQVRSTYVKRSPQNQSTFAAHLMKESNPSMTTATTVDAYIASQAPATQPRLQELRAIIRAAVPRAAEVISYGIPTYRLEARIVSFGAARRHCALYGTPMDLFADELSAFKTLKGTVQFPLDQPVPEALVRKLVLAKLAPE